MKQKGFTLIELLVVTVIIGILSAIGVPQLSKYNEQAGDAWRQAVIKNVTKIIMADEFISLDGVNFADLDSDSVYVGTDDPVTVEDLRIRLDAQDYLLPTDNKGGCFLYGYQANSVGNDGMLFIVDKQEDAGLLFDGTDDEVKEARNITSISCVPGSEGVTGGDWTDFQWLNFIP